MTLSIDKTDVWLCYFNASSNNWFFGQIFIPSFRNMCMVNIAQKVLWLAQFSCYYYRWWYLLLLLQFFLWYKKHSEDFFCKILYILRYAFVLFTWKLFRFNFVCMDWLKLLFLLISTVSFTFLSVLQCYVTNLQQYLGMPN